jgi:hypothetical protein
MTDAASTSTLTLPQTVCLLALSRDEKPPWFPVGTRNALLRQRWMKPGKPPTPGSKVRRRYDITDAGRQALAASPHLEAAQRVLDEGKQQRPWKPDLRSEHTRAR